MNLFPRLFHWYFSKGALPYWCILLLDFFLSIFAGIFVFWFYYHGAYTLGNLFRLCETVSIYGLINFIGFRLFHTYYGVVRYSSFVDLYRVGWAMIVNFILAIVFHYIVVWADLPLVPFTGKHLFFIYLLTTLMMWGCRVLVKSVFDASLINFKTQATLIYGIREGGIGIGKSLRSQGSDQFHLVGFLTDDPKFRKVRLLGMRVYPVDSNLPSVLMNKNVKAILVSPLQMESFRNNSDLQNVLLEAGVHIYMSSDVREWRPKDDFSNVHLKEISVEDLLPRQQIQVNMVEIGKMLFGKKVMITGDAGSIGSEMVDQIAKFKPSNLILIDQAETPQHDIRLKMRDYPELKVETIVVSITQADRMEHIFKTYRPDYVFHAAAYKHVPMMEDNPSEAILNNVLGTKIIADLSVKYGVKKFVMISTDKAVNPTNVMGCSKRICEIYCQSLNNYERQKGTGETQFVTTRFGNVLGSNGSVIPLFKKQIEAGGPVTVTHPDIIRFFMLIPEACKLVLEAGTHGKGGEIFVFDMGKPVKIADLARRMILLSGAKNVEIKYSGLREGEKLYEEVLSNAENTLPSFNEKIRIAKTREYDFMEVSKQIDELIAIAHTFDQMAIVKKMKEIVPEYVSNNSIYSVLDKKK